MHTVTMNITPNNDLTLQDISWLDKILRKYASKDSRVSTYVVLDGFLTGILSIVSTILPSQWIPYIFGGTMPDWQSEDEIKRFFSLVLARYNQICNSLDNYPDQYVPFTTVIYDNGKEGLRPDDWALGYLYAREIFDVLDINLATGEPSFLLKGFALIEKYAYSDACERLNELPPKKRDLEFKHLCQTILMIHHFYLKIRHEILQSNPNSIMPKQMQQSPLSSSKIRMNQSAPPAARAGHKIGRNDPCPCGSGKKYKKCCLLKQ